MVSLDGEIAMLRKVMWLLILFLFTCGCNRQGVTGDHPRELVGTWDLLIRSDCSGYGLKSDTLSLRSDGTFDQRVTAVDGRHFDATGEHWKFVPDHSIELAKRRDFFTSQNHDTLVGLAQEEVLIVEFGSPSVILLNPNSDCSYRKSS